MTIRLIELEAQALELRAVLAELEPLIRALPGETAEALAKVRAATDLADKLANGLADAQEAGA